MQTYFGKSKNKILHIKMEHFLNLLMM